MFSLALIGTLLAMSGLTGGHESEMVLKGFAPKSRDSKQRVVSLKFRAKEMRRAGEPPVESLELNLSNGEDVVLSLTKSEELHRVGVCGSHHVGTHDVMVTGCEGGDRSITIGGHGSWEYEASSATFRRVDVEDAINDCSSAMPPSDDEDSMAMKKAMNDMIANGEVMTAQFNNRAFDMEVRYYYDISLLERYDNDHERTKAAVRELNGHGEVLMRHESLGMPVNLLMRVEPVFVNLRTHAGPDNALNDFRGWLSQRNLCDDQTVAFHHLITNHRVGDGVAGVAYIGTVCHSRCYNTGITEINRSVARSATVLAHEMGHNLGAQHTFHPSNDGRNCRGIMSYGVAPDTWSVCSRDSWQADYNLFVRASGQNRADTCFRPSNGGPNLGGAAPTSRPVPRPVAPAPTFPPVPRPVVPAPTPPPIPRTVPSPTANPNGAGCQTYLGRDVASGFRHHAQSFRTGVTSDNACRNLCTAASGCTVWVRQPSANKCWLSTQTGTVRLYSRRDRNAGLRCVGAAPGPAPGPTSPQGGACRCSGRASRSGGADCTRGWCYTNPGSCADGRRSNALRDQEWSILACSANPSNPPNPTPNPTPAPTTSGSNCENVHWTRFGRCGSRFGGQVCNGRRNGRSVWRYCSRFGWCGDSRAHNVGNVAYDHPKGCVVA